jgi:hypothetical protein
MRSIKVFAAAVAVAIVTPTIGAANAQDQPQCQQSQRTGEWIPNGMMGYGGMGPWLRGLGNSGRAICAKVSHIAGRLAYIKAELKITDAQEPLWESYAAAARNDATVIRERCSVMLNNRDASAGSLPDLLDQHVELMATRLDAVRAMTKALKPLYAALSEEQKQIAEQIFSGPIGMM